MSKENEVPFSSDLDYINVDNPKKSLLKKILVILGFLAIVGYILDLILSFREDNSYSYITAIYTSTDPLSNRYKFYNIPSESGKITHLLISSITVDGVNVKVAPYHEFSNTGNKTVRIEF